jgi:hypothetical protein
MELNPAVGACKIFFVPDEHGWTQRGEAATTGARPSGRFRGECFERFGFCGPLPESHRSGMNAALQIFVARGQSRMIVVRILPEKQIHLAGEGILFRNYFVSVSIVIHPWFQLFVRPADAASNADGFGNERRCG